MRAPTEFRPTKLEEKLFLGMKYKDYLKSNITLFNGILTAILIVGIPVMVYRIFFGLGPSTNLSDYNPWGLWIGFDMMCGIALAAGGFVVGTAVHLMGMKEYHCLVRPALLTGCLGYFFAVVGLIFDLGRYYRLHYAFFVSPGVQSILFIVALSVALYLVVQFFEWCPAIFEWLNLKKPRKIFVRATVGLTVAGVLLTTGHQSALGALFLLMPSKVHPLWYSEYLPLWFFISAIIGGLSMVIFESMISHRFFADHVRDQDPAHFDRITLGLGKACALVLFAYFGLKVLGLAHDNTWCYLTSGYGLWYLAEVLGFVLFPALVFMYAVQNKLVVLVRAIGIWTALGIIVNRLNLCIICFNWHLPWADRYIPSWMEITITISIIVIGIITFRLIINRMPILYEHPDFKSEAH